MDGRPKRIKKFAFTIVCIYNRLRVDGASVNPPLLWEMIKLKVREKSVRYSKIKTKQTKQRELSVEQTIARLQEELDHI